MGLTRSEVVYELFLTNLPQGAFLASDVLALAPPIAGPLNQFLPTKTRSRTPTAGVLMLPLGRNVGRSSPNGSGTCAWRWVINLSLLPYVPPSLLQPFHRCLSAPRLPLATLLPRLACPGKPPASLGATLLLKLMGRYAAPRARSCARLKGVKKPMSRCGYSTTLRLSVEPGICHHTQRTPGRGIGLLAQASKGVSCERTKQFCQRDSSRLCCCSCCLLLAVE